MTGAGGLVLAVVLGMAPSCSKSAEERRQADEETLRGSRLSRAQARKSRLQRLRSSRGQQTDLTLPSDAGAAPAKVTGPDAAATLPQTPAWSVRRRASALLREPYTGKPDARQPATASSKAWAALRPKGRDELAALLNGNLAFALDLYARVRLTPTLSKANLFFSPWSISTALTMATAGARAHTEKELRRVLHLTSGRDQVNRAVGRLIKELGAAQKPPQVRVNTANRLWVQKGMRLLPAYSRVTRRHYGARAMEADFAGNAEKMRKQINRWVSQQTRKKIKELFKSGVINAQSRLVLANAIFFKGDWDKPFVPSLTREAPFLLPGCRRMAVPMMRYRRSKYYPYAKVPGLELLDLPYKGRKLSMTILLPSNADSLAAVEGRLTSANLRDWFSKLHIEKVSIQLPRFRLKSSFALKDVLVALGAKSAFGNADFSGMVQQGGLAFSAVVHEAFVDVNEKGTVAAAATGGVMLLSAPKRFHVDRPFLFLIRHRATGAILFFGRVTSPKPGAKTSAVPDCVPGAADAGTVSPGRPGHRRRRRGSREGRVHSASVVGGLDRDEVNVVIQRSAKALRRCWTISMGPAGGSPAKRRMSVQLSLHISTSGLVTRAEVLRSRRSNNKAGQCVRKLARSWRFPGGQTEPTVVALRVFP